MRITAETKQQTRRQILDSAHKLFCANGFERASTREIASASGIAAGTLFNYFPTKEALAMTLVSDALNEAQDEFGRRQQGNEPLEEALFALIAIGLRHLRPLRPYAGEVLEAALTPFARAGVCEESEQVRVTQLETVRELLTARGGPEQPEPSFVALHLWWTLYLGVLAFWSQDSSHNQEDTLVVLDQSVRLFVGSLADGPSPDREVAHGA